MNVLPWLLDWPPRPATVVAFLLLTAFSAGTLALFGGVTDEMTGENVTVEAVDLTVRLNDDGTIPDVGNGTVQTCLASGTPGDRISVLGDVTVAVPVEGYEDAVDDRRLRVVVRLAPTGETVVKSVEHTGRTTHDVFRVLEDDETLSVGDAARVDVRVRTDESVLADATREVTVENGSRSYDC
ncbi:MULTISPECIES: hypothetical protein [Halorussus]|uniref:hypothetical protein n=1 Tax=Halorussus TaxID=1070314 RepID=UPI0013B4194C|nr:MULTISPECIES: hypothetical protein [Halorussus]NHN60268.1 hypothetical protein [Halorussus sp. JP-T4]